MILALVDSEDLYRFCNDSGRFFDCVEAVYSVDKHAWYWRRSTDQYVEVRLLSTVPRNDNNALSSSSVQG